MSKKCPRCGSLKLRRSAYQGFQEGVFHVLQSPVRCEECDERFWILSRLARTLIFWIFVLMIAAATIALLIPARAPEVPTQRTSALPSGGAIAPDVRGG